LEDYLRINEPDEQARNLQQMVRPVNAFETHDPYSPYLPVDAGDYGPSHLQHQQSMATLSGPYRDDDADYDRKTLMTEGDDEFNVGLRTPDGTRSFGAASEVYAPSRALFDSRTMNEKSGFEGNVDEEVVERKKRSPGRARWIVLTWLFTWWIPSIFLSKCGGMKRSDIRMAWREKLLIK
jgi:chitin synthase